MAVGRAASQSAADINSRVGGLAYELEDLMNRIQRTQAFMLATDLKVAPYNMVTGDENTVKSAMTDMAQLASIHDGAANLASAKDFRTFVKQLVGIP